MNYFRDYIEVILFYLFLQYFKKLPTKSVLYQLKIIAFVLGYCFCIRKNVVMRQLRLVFPEKNTREIKNLTKQIYAEMAVTVAEVFIFTDTYFIDKSEVKGIENIDKALEYGQGVIVISAHFSNWELGIKTLAKRYQNVSGVVKQQRNMLFDSFIEAKRREANIQTIKMKNAIKYVLQALKKNEIVVFAIDQYAFKQGVEIDFLGHPTLAYSSIAQIAIKYRIPVVPAFDLRDEVGHHKAIFHQPFIFDYMAYNENNVLEVTKKLNNVVENYILEYPHLWFWVHKKWRKPFQVSK
ncbi:MAG: lysophospholipid acyltransferase family protein [Candidatus Cloacimonetes bacterium]|nr:lysophospholipid acyltransferase family protein [Candidatus Cloacimonadota bacterium]